MATVAEFFGFVDQADVSLAEAQLRLKCLELAIKMGATDPVAEAKKIHSWVKDGT